jgi:hypothetical protein
MMTTQEMMKVRKLANERLAQAQSFEHQRLMKGRTIANERYENMTHEHMEHERKESRLKEMAERVYKPQNFTIQGSVNKMLSKKNKNDY